MLDILIPFSPERTPHGLVVHVGFIFVLSPQLGHGLGVDQLEDAFLTVSPLDVFRAALVVLQQLQKELPQECCGPWQQQETTVTRLYIVCRVGV